MKRILSLILCLAMVLTMLPPQVFATETEQPATELTETETTAPAETTVAAEAMTEATVQQTIPEEAVATDATEEAPTTAGTCGESLTWALDEAGVLIISGCGAMEDYKAYTYVPWCDVAAQIKTVVVENGVTTVGSYAFYGCGALTGISIPDSVISIGESAFHGCSALKEIVIPASVTTVSKNTFYNCTELSSVVLPEGLNSIGAKAFLGCSALTEIVIPDSVTTIDEKAFQYCGLESVHFGKNVTRIESEVFYCCDALTELILPEGLTSIGESAFRACEGLTTVDMPDTVEFIGNSAFANCTNLTDIHLSEDISAIGSQTFRYCLKLDNVTIPDGVETIGVEAFSECKVLSAITIPASVHTIDEKAFQYCGLEELILCGDKLTIGSRAFYFCRDLSAIYFLGDAPAFAEDCFEEVASAACYPADNTTWSADKQQDYGGTLTWGPLSGHMDLNKDHTCDCGCGEMLSQCTDADCNHKCDVCGAAVSEHTDENQDHVCDYGCADPIGEHADKDNDHICDYCKADEPTTTCTGGTATCGAPAICEICRQSYGEKNPANHESEAFTYTWTMLQHTAFHACCGVETVTENHIYENGLCVCGKEEPAGYDYLENFYWELDQYGTMTIIGEGAIEDGSAWAKYAAQVKALEIDSRITSIGEDAFAGFANLTTLSFPGTASVAKNAFSGCAALKTVTVTGTGAMVDYTETSCKNLPWFCTNEVGLTVTLAEGLTTVGAFAFCGAENVTAVVLPEGLETIGEKAFRGSGLVNISVPDTVTAIAAGALSELKKCTVLELPDSVVSLGDGALRGSAFQAVKLPGNLTAIGSELLKDCENLNTVNIPEGVTVIGREAFRGCKALMGIRLPDGVTRIEDGAFRSCAMLYTVILPEKLTEIGAYAFAADTYLVTLTIKSKELTVGEKAFSGCSTLARVYFSGTKEQWEALSIASGNGALTGAKVHFCTETGGPVQQLQILHRSGLQLPEGEALEGRNILVNMAQSSEIVLGYAVWPEDAVNQEVIWDNNNRTVVDAAVNAEGGYTLIGKQAGDVTVVVMNYGSGGSYTYVNTSARFQFRRMVMADSFRGYMTPDGTQQLEAYIEGDGDLDRGILWTMVEDQTGEAKLTSDGLLTVGENQGTVIVRAEAADGSGLSVTATITVISYAVVVSGPTQVASGKSITLTAELVPSGLTNTKILWKLKNSEDSQFVTLNNGKITAKTVKAAQEVVVVAYPADGVAAQAEVAVTVVPITASVEILQGERYVTGQTIPVNLNTWKEALAFTAVTAPEDASKAVKWTTSDSKDAYAAYIAGDDGSYTLVPTGKTGTVTLTATAADGSGKKATVKVQFVKAATEIRILNAPEDPIRAGSKLTLTTSVATEAELTDRNVAWSLSPESLPYASITDKGVLTTYAYPGQVTITVTAAVKSDLSICDQKSIVLKPGATAAVISHKDESLAKNEIIYAAVGEAITLTGSTLPEEAIQGGTWKVSGKGAVLTDNGDGTATVIMSAAGTATVTFTAADGSKKSLSVKIQAIQRGGDMTITAAKNATELRSGKTLQLTATIPGATLKKFSWTVDKPELATVSNTGKVKALTVYENTTVTVTAAAIDGSGLTASYELLVRPAKDQTLHIKLDGEVITGTTRYLHLNGAGQTLTMELYDSLTGQWTAVTANLTLSGKQLMLDGTTVKGLAIGSGTVTAKYGKLSAKVTFKVVNPVESISLYEKDGTYHMVAGKSLTLKANLFGAGGLTPTEKKLKWTVDNPAAATVSASGVVKANKNLTRQTVITVTASATDGSGVSETRMITLYPLPTAILISANGIVLNQCVREFKVGDTLTLDANILPGDAMQDVTFSISGKLAALETAGDGTVTLKLNGEGTLTIKAATNDGSKRTVTVKIKIVK